MREFKFGDKVRVTNGFYKDCEGILTHKGHAFGKDSRSIFEVEIRKLDAENSYREQIIEVYSNNLLVIKKAK